jgi:hypothetical protein
MMRRSVIAALALGFAFSTCAYAAPCRDANGKFIKCAPPVPASKCRDANGKFTKCQPGPGKTG